MIKNDANARDVEPPPTSASEKPARAPRSRVRKFLWITGAVAVALGAAYGGGRLQTHAQITGLEQQLLDAQRELDLARVQQAAQTQQLGELEARRQMHLALIAFDQNNFGTAQQHLRQAAGLLEAGDPALKALAAALEALELSPTLDLASQRTTMVQLASKFDGIRPPPGPAP